MPKVTKDQIIAINHTLNTPGWKILEEYLTNQKESYTLQLESQLDDHRYLQGQVAGYRQMLSKIKEYRDASKKG